MKRNEIIRYAMLLVVALFGSILIFAQNILLAIAGMTIVAFSAFVLYEWMKEGKMPFLSDWMKE